MSEEKARITADIDIVEGLSELLNAQIDHTQNILGHRWLERGTFATLIGSSGVGKSVAAMQIAIEAAAGKPVFGMTPVRPLKVLLVQSEDSKNDRISQTQCVRELLKDPEEFKRADDNLLFLTTNRRGYRLFNHLEDAYTDDETGEFKCNVDLFIFNPAFAFFDGGSSVEDSKDVGFFLRTELMPFLQKSGAAAIVVHHTPKLINRDTSKWSAQTHMYAGHGSAEWTNAPRAVITIDNTKSTKVYQFRIAKRGSQSGWEESNGEYVRYFSHAPKNMPMHWIPSTEEEIAESQQESGLRDEDVLNVFTEDEPEKSVAEIYSQITKEGFKFSETQIKEIIGRLVNKNRLHKVGGKYVLAKIVKKVEKEEEKAAQAEAVFKLIQDSPGIIMKDLIAGATFNKDSVASALANLGGRVRVEPKGLSKHYFINAGETDHD
jgi:RecA-family ATPase